MQELEKEKLKKEVALFRYGLIAPIITNTYEEPSMTQYFKNVANKTYVVNGKKEKYSWQTIKWWYEIYKKDGYEALVPKTRKDFCQSRKLNEDAINQLIDIKERYPHITGTLIYQKLSETGFINPNDVSLSTVLKYIRDNKSKFNETTVTDRRAFVMEHANDCWQADTSHGPYILINGKKVLTYLIAIIDDASRMIVGAKFFFNDNGINLQEVMKNAIKTYGIPKKLFVDNGGTYKNEQFNIICATLGLILIHARPYSGASKGKIERFFHTMKATWMRGLNWDEINSIDDLNVLLNEFINNYNNSVHSSLENEDKIYPKPRERWFKDVNLIKKLDNNFIDMAFLHEATCKIRSDAIANIKGNQYEVPMKYINQRVKIKYDPIKYEFAWIYDDVNKKLISQIKMVDKIANSKIRRKSTLY